MLATMHGFMPMATSSPVPHALPGAGPPPPPGLPPHSAASGAHHLPGLERPSPPGLPAGPPPHSLAGLLPHHPAVGLDVRTLSPHQLNQLHQHEQVKHE